MSEAGSSTPPQVDPTPMAPIPGAMSEQIQRMAANLGAPPKAPVAPAVPVAAESVAPRAEVRDEKGRFVGSQPDENIPKLREALKNSQRQNRDIARALEDVTRVVSELKAQKPVVATEPRWKQKMAEILPELPPETQGFVKNRMAPILEAFHSEVQGMVPKAAPDTSAEDAMFERELSDFVEDKTFDGFTVTPEAILKTLLQHQKQGISLGRTPRQQFENAHRIILAGAPKVTAQEMADREKADADAKKRAGGVPPGQSPSIDPDRRSSREEYGRQLRNAAVAGDYGKVRELTMGTLSGIASKMRASKEWQTP